MSSKQIQTITEEEERLLVLYLSKPHHTERQKIRCYRNLAMFYLMLDAGLRVGEVVRLPRNSLFVINQLSCAVYVPATIAKNKTCRTIPMTDNLYKYLSYAQTFIWKPRHIQLLDYAFFQLDSSIHLTTRSVELTLEKISYEYLQRKVTPHMLRHTFATRLIKRANISIVKMLLGHKSIKSTEIYLHPSWEDCQKAVNGNKNACG